MTQCRISISSYMVLALDRLSRVQAPECPCGNAKGRIAYRFHARDLLLLRRVLLISNSVGDAVLIGSNHSSDTLRLREFLARNGQPHTYLDVEVAPEVQTILNQFGVPLADVPVLICGGTVPLHDPSNSYLGFSMGISRQQRSNPRIRTGGVVRSARRYRSIG